jgi:hypothetical protein
MNAVMKNKPAPPTVDELRARLAAHEHDLIEVTRMNSAARTVLGRLMAEGDAAAVAECQREIKLSGAKVEELTDTIEAVREAVRLAQARGCAAERARARREIERAAVAVQRDLLAAAPEVKALCRRFTAISTGVQDLAAHMTRAGVRPEPCEQPHALYRVLPALLEHALFLDTGGKWGKSRTLYGTTELAQGVTGSQTLQHAAEEFLALTMRRV